MHVRCQGLRQRSVFTNRYWVSTFLARLNTTCSRGAFRVVLCPSCVLNNFFNLFPIRQILDSSKLKEFADDNFESDENGRKFSRRVENIVGKGEIARHEQFLLFPTMFSKDLYCRHVKTGACFGKG